MEQSRSRFHSGCSTRRRAGVELGELEDTDEWMDRWMGGEEGQRAMDFFGSVSVHYFLYTHDITTHACVHTTTRPPSNHMYKKPYTYA